MGDGPCSSRTRYPTNSIGDKIECSLVRSQTESGGPMTEQEIQDKGYANPEALVSTQWVAEHLDDTQNIRLVESDEDVLLYDIGHVPNAVKIDWVEDLNDPLMRDYLDPEH